MAIVRLHHTNISIPTGKEDEARVFYCDLPGLEEIKKPDELQINGGLWLKLGAVDLHIGIQDGVDFSGLATHLAYEVDDLATWREKLAEAGITFEAADTPIPDFDRFKIRDPFGNLIEFVQPR